MTPTQEQLAIISAARDSTDNLLLSALAGAAKTSTLVLIAEALPDTEILCLAFNKKVAIEMGERLPRNCKSMTLNSLGHRTWSEATGRRIRIESGKTYNIVKAAIEEQSRDDARGLYEQMAELMRLVDFGKACGYIPTGSYDRAKRLMDDEDFFPHLEQRLSPLEEDIIRGATLASLRQAFDGLCDFNDQILMPTIFHGAFPRYPLVLVDEAQDLSALNHATLRKLCKKRLIAVGDQCQPAGTLISIVERAANTWHPVKLRKVPIEQLQVGDKLLGYNGVGAFMFNRKVEGISSQLFEGEMITVKMRAGETSRYTENHHCYASFEPFRKHFALYLMQQGDKFRIGRCRMDYECGSGPTRRAHVEKADAYWILGLYETEREAALEEAVAQAQFGIPDITFNCPNTNVGFASQSFLDEAWSYILASVDLKNRAADCLNRYHKMLEYPIWRKGFPAKFSLLRPMIVQACNLISGCLMLPYNGDSKILKTDWERVEVTFEWVEDVEVYSLTVSDNNLYVADNIVTHNCQAIYGFRGAHKDSMSKLRATFDMKEMSLSISFRCPTSVVEHVRWRAPQMRWPDWAKPGTVTHTAHWSANDLAEQAAIICRNNAPLFGLAIRLLKNGRTCELEGKDIIQAITKVMRKFGSSDMRQVDVFERIDAWLAAELEKNKPRAHSRVKDRAECMVTFALQGATLGDGLAYAQHMMQLHSPLKLMTIHKAKGLEFDHVYFLDAKLVGDENQEPNLKYVACTRAKETLTYINSGGFQDEHRMAEPNLGSTIPAPLTI